MSTRLEPAKLLVSSNAEYTARLAASPEEIRAAQQLRFQVFNVELKEGLSESFATGLDADPFDAVCDHLLVEHLASKVIVGTYRLQTGASAAARLGYYSAQEFDFQPYERVRHEIVELGRACVHHQHRNLSVLGMLWKGIADYCRQRGARYLIGCSSLTSQDPRDGASMYAELHRKYLVAPEFRTRPLEKFECPLDQLANDPPKVPKLLRAYLSIGASICGPPALDREFKTIDFLTFVDLASMPGEVKRRFLG
ncbi:MAG: GNAT family N-acyltransferase [Verrucomicrobiota bacterium]